ncbi:MAG: hypothetical protein ACKVZJ_10305 [Phycisphaerales bacterium]
MSTPRTNYLSVDQVNARLLTLLFSSNPMLLAWTAASGGDKLVACNRAMDDVDAVLWTGRVAVLEQMEMWPRVRQAAVGSGEQGQWGAVGSALVSESTRYVHPDAIDSDAQVARIPREIKGAFAIQAAHHCLLNSGLGAMAATEHVAAAAQRGVTSMSVGGQSESVDLKRATSPWAALHPEAARLVAHLRSAGGGFE